MIRVNDKPITEADVRLAEADIATDLLQMPRERRREAVLEFLIESQLLADAAEQARLDGSRQHEARRRYQQRRTLRDTYFEARIRDTVSEADVRRAYDEQAATIKRQDQFRAVHILVDSESAAVDIRRKIVGGADFAALARESSRDNGTAANGGDLGFVEPGQLDPRFEAAVLKLATGELSSPIQTKFGWHVVRVEERRLRPVPTYEEAKDFIRLEMVLRRTRETVAAMRKDARIVYVSPDNDRK